MKNPPEEPAVERLVDEPPTANGEIIPPDHANGNGHDKAHALAEAAERFATLSQIDYELLRIGESRRLGVRASALDRLVQAFRQDIRPPDEPAQQLEIAPPPPTEPDADRPPEFSDDALAVAFVDKHRHDLRYCRPWGKWLVWDRSRWRVDHVFAVFHLVRLVCRAKAVEAEFSNHKAASKIAHLVASGKTHAAVERAARSDPAHARDADAFDQSIWLLNTPAGTIDLQTGIARPADPADEITKTTAVAADPAGGCSNWLAFLEWAAGGDVDMVAYLRRIAGYMLTGTTREHALFFLYGTGGNGKGTFINTITGIMGDYATGAPMETFVASRGDRHPTELAGLRGYRMVQAQETDEGRQWAQAKIASITGGDPITARFMGKDFFTYQPQFKLLIAGNHKPALRNVNEAMRRRFNLIPFAQTIDDEHKDEQLGEKLRAEWPAILAWAVAGCLEWQRLGLGRPAAVTAATDGYFEAEDVMALWFEECCSLGASNWSAGGDLFKSWKQWSDARGESPGSHRRFTQAMEDRGFRKRRGGSSGVRGFEGICVLVQYSTRTYDDEN